MPIRPVRYFMFASEHAMQEMPAPGSVIFDVEANSYTMSALPYFSHAESISGNGTYSPSNSWMP